MVKNHEESEHNEKINELLKVAATNDRQAIAEFHKQRLAEHKEKKALFEAEKKSAVDAVAKTAAARATRAALSAELAKTESAYKAARDAQRAKLRELAAKHH